MKPADDSEKLLFLEALQRASGPEREAYLDQACAGNEVLRHRLAALLQAHESPDPFLEPPAAPPGIGTVLLPPEEGPGTLIGRYKILEKIGEGGFGFVYVAEQREPVKRRVALKIIKLGMDTRQVVARFEAERQALALMDHPNIAKVLDGGATDTGRPYFVMELVRGVRITDYCDQHHLSTEERLTLFVQVCHALQHAHQKGVIHRDIKPSNILVMLADEVPVPKVIDFGIAKAIGERLTDKTVYTRFEQFIGTPAYMSPEQAGFSGLDVDTRSDIYALGVLLYELLTGRTPFEPKQLAQAGLDEIRRCIQEEEPPKPSTRLSRLERQEQTTTAQRRATEAPKLIRSLRGDLDWIVMKCLEKDRTRRYDTANGLANDIERHLDQQPVSAAAPGALYRAGKFTRRHKVGLGMAAALALLLAAGVVVSTWEAVRAMRARQDAVKAEQEARAEATKSGQVAHFLKDMLEGVGPSVALGRDTKLLKEILDRTAERVGKELADQPEVQAELRSIIGNTFFELGEFARAEAMQREALRLRRSLFGQTNELVASSLSDLGSALWRQGRYTEAEAMQREALALRRALLGQKHPAVANSLACLAQVLDYQGKGAEAEATFREALALQRELAANNYPVLADLLNAFANVLIEEGSSVEAESVSREAVALAKQLPGDANPTLATSLLRLGWALEAQGRLAEAEDYCRQAVAMRRKLLGNEHHHVASALERLADVLDAEGKLAEAEALERECLAIRENKMPDDWQTFATRSWVGGCLLAQKKYGEAEPLLLSGYFGMKQREDTISAYGKPRLARALRYVVQFYEATSQPEKAAEWKREATKLYRKQVEQYRKAAELGSVQALNGLAWLLATCADSNIRDGPRAVSLAEKAVAMTDRKDPNTLDTLAAAYAEAGQFTTAVSLQQEAIALLHEEKMKKSFASRLRLYQSSSPYRE